MATLRLLIVVLAWALAFAGPACAASIDGTDIPPVRPGAPEESRVAGTTRERVQVDGNARHFFLHLPGKVPAGPLPVVLSFHGRGSNAAMQELISEFSALSDEHGFAAVYPEGEHNLWHAYDGRDVDVRFVDALLADLRKRFAVDESRIFASGFSNGAQMAMVLGCVRPKLFAALGLVAGSYPKVCDTARPPMIAFHGTKDDVLPFKPRKDFMDVREFAAGWAGESCRLSQTGDLFFQHGDASGERWACGAREAVLYTLEGKGHSWPGSRMLPRYTSRDVDASAAMWAFFAAHPKR